ncbi:MAG TPA: 4-alpha-glucanotransferase [Phycisphaerae bacterium]|nr:4-alpha-glucanotransferase [Phycisphaerae bacterium]
MKRTLTLSDRAAGVLLHPTSLPGRHGCGDLGPAAYEFVDFLAAAGVRWWQMLPVGPPGLANSPYAALSAFAGNAMLISLERLVTDGLLDAADSVPARGLPPDRVAYSVVTRYKHARLRKAFDRFVQRGGLKRRAFTQFCAAQSAWLDDHALYTALRQAHGNAAWPEWPRDVRLRERAALRQARDTLRAAIDCERFVQFEFDRQWSALKKYANTHGVGLIGDIPIFVAHDSSDVWSQRALFDLDAAGRPRTISGVPPDYFSRTGQLWRHPHYAWRRHQATGFAWWIARFRRMQALFDAVRIDHFLGFNRVWAVPGRAQTARRGKWVKTPGRELFTALRRALGRLEIIAEDLGLVTPEAAALRDRCGFPGMRLLHFGFGPGNGPRYIQPHTFPRNCVVYPGTHDNETTVGWFAHLRQAAHKRRPAGTLSDYDRVLRYLGTDGRAIHWDMIRLALSSPANTAIIPAQDLLGLGNEARMNTPATTTGNWQWRLRPGRLTPTLATRLREMTEAYDRER